MKIFIDSNNELKLKVFLSTFLNANRSEKSLYNKVDENDDDEN